MSIWEITCKNTGACLIQSLTLDLIPYVSMVLFILFCLVDVFVQVWDADYLKQPLYSP